MITEAAVSYETILFEQSEDKVATVTINRPDAMNSFNRKMCEEFRDVWERARVDPTINAVVLIVSGLLGLLLLWPNTERARLIGEAPQPKFA